jgi:hypothetical protein
MVAIGENISATEKKDNESLYKFKDVLFGRSPTLMRYGMMINWRRRNTKKTLTTMTINMK